MITDTDHFKKRIKTYKSEIPVSMTSHPTPLLHPLPLHPPAPPLHPTQIAPPQKLDNFSPWLWRTAHGALKSQAHSHPIQRNRMIKKFATAAAFLAVAVALGLKLMVRADACGHVLTSLTSYLLSS